MTTGTQGTPDRLPETSPAAFWRRRAKWTAWRYNVGCILSGFLPVGLGLSIIFACALLVLRENDARIDLAWLIYAVALLSGLGAMARRAVPRFFDSRAALTRLDWHLRLHSRLSAAAAGVGAYPDPRKAGDGYGFRFGRIVWPLAASATLVVLAGIVPLAGHARVTIPTTAPLAWTQTAQWVDALQKAEVVQPPALEELRERLEQLRKQPTQDWYSQSSLEAGDNLRDQTAKAIEALQHDLQATTSDLANLQRFTDQTSPNETKETRENLAKALQGLELGNLPLNRDLLNGLKNVDLANLKTLTPAELAALRQRMQECEGVCQACLHPGQFDEDAKHAVAIAAVVGANPSQIQPGGGTEALYLNEKPTDLHTTTTESVSNGNLEHALPGDVVGVGKGQHEVDPTRYSGPTNAGAVAAKGEGGDTIWRNDLTPKERAVLKNFYK